MDANQGREFRRLHRLIEQYARASHAAATRGDADEARALLEKMRDPVQKLRDLYERLAAGNVGV